MAYVSIVNYSGRLFDTVTYSKLFSQPKEDGLLTTIDYSGSGASTKNTRTKILEVVRAKGVAFNDVGDQFIISDTRGSVIIYYLSQNRYMGVARSAKSSDKLGFVPNIGSENVIVANTDFTISVYTQKGKLLSTLRGHRSPIIKF